jgi:long-subunit acyl-CoA synthetase (AMP-forming)
MLTLYTSGSTDEPKIVTHSWQYIKQCAKATIKEIGLTKNDRVLNVFPANTIAHYCITAFPASLSGAQLVSSDFNAYAYSKLFVSVKPTVISLIPRHLTLLQNTKNFKNLDMSCVRYMVTGSNKIEQSFIDAFREQGVQLVANWYGMTECPPPVMIGYNSEKFDIKTVDTERFKVEFKFDLDSGLSECYINNQATGDLFDADRMIFIKRKQNANGKTWKNNF